MKVHVLRCDNNEVTDFYLDMIVKATQKALSKKNQECTFDNIFRIDEVTRIQKSEYFIVATCLAAFKLYIKGYKNIIIWFQGVDPEESYMRNHSRLRYYILSVVEKYVLKHVRFKVFVSNEMIKHYENKYRIYIDREHSMVMPCFNDKIDLKSFEQPNKYEKNSFCYVGSTAKWQKFETIVALYRDIEKVLENTNFLVLTGDIKEAKDIIINNNIKNYVVKHVKPEEVAGEIKNFKFGFIIRDNCTVNRVSTPTKISNYMASGVIPIFSSCICDFADLSKQMKYVVKVDDYNNIGEIIDKIKEFEQVSYTNIQKEYYNVFQFYYSDEKYIDELSDKLFERLF